MAFVYDSGKVDALWFRNKSSSITPPAIPDSWKSSSDQAVLISTCPGEETGFKRCTEERSITKKKRGPDHSRNLLRSRSKKFIHKKECPQGKPQFSWLSRYNHSYTRKRVNDLKLVFNGSSPVNAS